MASTIWTPENTSVPRTAYEIVPEFNFTLVDQDGKEISLESVDGLDVDSDTFEVRSGNEPIITHPFRGFKKSATLTLVRYTIPDPGKSNTTQATSDITYYFERWEQECYNLTNKTQTATIPSLYRTFTLYMLGRSGDMGQAYARFTLNDCLLRGQRYSAANALTNGAQKETITMLCSWVQRVEA